jgi:acyl-CoA synthetase (AMP-forming)/AMP-acid ligase II
VLIAGGAIFFMEKFDPVAAVRALGEHRITWLPQIPAQFQLMFRDGRLSASDFATVRSLAWGGAAMPRGLVERLSVWVPDLFGSYGLTECSGTIAISAPGATLEELVGTVGKPVDAAFVRIAGPDGRIDSGETGEIQIRGPHLFLGYLGNPAASRASFTADGWLKTGDLGAIDARGNLVLRGRTREMYKSGGYNVYPSEVESVVERLPGVELCAVVGVPDDLWGEVGVAFVQADPARVTGEALASHCSALLARYKIPKQFHVRASLPLLPVGKVDRQALRSALLAGRSPATGT